MVADSGRAAFLTPREVSEAVRVHAATIRRMVRDHELEAIRVGRQVRIPRRAVEQLLGRVPEPNP